MFFFFFPLLKRAYASGDVYPNYVKIPKGEYTLQLYIRYIVACCIRNVRAGIRRVIGKCEFSLSFCFLKLVALFYTIVSF